MKMDKRKVMSVAIHSAFYIFLGCLLMAFTEWTPPWALSSNTLRAILVFSILGAVLREIGKKES